MIPAIQTRNLTRNFGDRAAVDDLSLEVPAGEIFGFLGPNGAGKTTTIRMLLGLMRPTRGSASVLGYDVTTQGTVIRRSVGAMLEDPGIYERLTVAENLELVGRIWELSAAERRARTHRLLERFGLEGRAGSAAGQLSRGMKQKLAVARALLPEPELLFLDEPTANLDPEAAHSLRNDLVELVRERRITVFLTTHNLEEAERICSRVGLLRAGRLLAVGSPDELRPGVGRGKLQLFGRAFGPAVLARLRSSAAVASVSGSEERLTVEMTGPDQVPAIIRAVVEAGGEIERVAEPTRTLEEVYLEMMESVRA